MNWLELKLPPLLLALVCAGAMPMLDPLLADLWPPQGWPRLPALLLAVGEGVCCLLGVRHFRQAGTSVNPLAPQAASALVCGGIYRYSRNPMYLGFVLALAGVALWLADPLALGLVPLFALYLQRFQILPEERALTARFGDAYRHYRCRVRRWL